MLILIKGLSCSGKKTFTKYLIEEKGFQYIKCQDNPYENSKNNEINILNKLCFDDFLSLFLEEQAEAK